MQDIQQLVSRIAKLTPAQQAIVDEFVKSLEKHPELNVREAMDEFKREHGELLRLLAS
jgi:O-methyltransferase involved in polyketide biosynthesis